MIKVRIFITSDVVGSYMLTYDYCPTFMDFSNDGKVSGKLSSEKKRNFSAEIFFKSKIEKCITFLCWISMKDLIIQGRLQRSCPINFFILILW